MGGPSASIHQLSSHLTPASNLLNPVFRPDARDYSRLQKQKEEEEKWRSVAPSDPRDSGVDMSLYQSPEYYVHHMKLLPPEIRPFHLHHATLALKKVEAVRPGGLVLDLCCGTGWASLALAAAHPHVFFVGVDNSNPMLQVCVHHCIYTLRCSVYAPYCWCMCMHTATTACWT